MVFGVSVTEIWDVTNLIITKACMGTGLFVESGKNLEDQDFDVSDEPVLNAEEGTT